MITPEYRITTIVVSHHLKFSLGQDDVINIESHMCPTGQFVFDVTFEDGKIRRYYNVFSTYHELKTNS